MPTRTLKAKFGLPGKVRFCTRCVLSNQVPASCIEYEHTIKSKKETMPFSKDGLCHACAYADIKEKEIDWEAREKELLQLLDRYRKHDGSYDVVVPGSGGKDSVMASHLLKYKYGMHPLTVTWPPAIYTDVGWKNFQNWIRVGGFDNLSFHPNGRVHALITRLAFENIFHPFQPFIFGQKNLAPKIALRYDIPLIFYGENNVEYNGSMDGAYTPTQDEKYFAKNKKEIAKIHLGGISVRDIMSAYGLSLSDLDIYLPSNAEEIHAKGISVHYLGYYVKWVPQEAYYYAVEHSAFEANPERTEGTYSKYNSIDDRIDGLFYWTMYVKFGLGRATWDASQEIRNRHLTREEGVALVKKFDGEFPRKYFKEILEYMGITEERFWEAADTFRSPHLWKKEKGEWKLRHRVA